MPIPRALIIVAIIAGILLYVIFRLAKSEARKIKEGGKKYWKNGTKG